jgi:hypothetical protein
MNPRRSFAIGTAAVAALLFASAGGLQGAENVVTPPMAGHWTGNAQIIVVWCRQKNLPVSVDIGADGSVRGKVGDATLKDGRFKRNRGWLGRKLDLKTDYIIVGKLEGPVIASEQIVRSGVSIPLNFGGGVFSGGVHTSGTHVGDKQHMVLSAQSLALVRTNSP